MTMSTQDEDYVASSKNSRKSRELLNWLYDHLLDLTNEEIYEKLKEIKEYKSKGDLHR